LRDKKLPEPAVVLHPMPGTPLPSALMNAMIKCSGILSVACDPKVDDSLVKLSGAGTEAEYVSAYREVEATLRDNRYIVPLLEAGTVMAGNKKIRPDYSVGTGYLGINLQQVYRQ
jgi:ABC-type oligopeptide transport system substrate-binding subunit